MIDTASTFDLSRYFLPYQIEAIMSEKRLALYEKSVRIGITFAMGFRAVRRRLKPGYGDLLYTSVNEGGAKLFINDCKKFCRIYELVYNVKVGDSEIDEFSSWNPLTSRQESSFKIHFDGTSQEIRAYSSNPDALRGAGGEVNVDELSSHQQPEEMLKAAGSRAIWGYPVWIWTSHKGEDSCFNRMIKEERAKGSASRWAIFSTDLYEAISQGLLAKINEVRGMNMSRDDFIADTIAAVGGQEAFEEECLLHPRKGGAAAIKWSYIEAARLPYDIVRFDITGKEAGQIEGIAQAVVDALAGSGKPELGYDVARTGHLSAVYVNDKEGEKHRLKGLVTMSKMKFGDQRLLVEKIMSRVPTMVGGGDKTGLGMQVCEELEDRFGESRFIGMNFGTMKPELGTNMVRGFEDGRVILPSDTQYDDIAWDFNGIQTKPLPSGRVQFYESSNPIEKRSHCDIAWAAALAMYAGKGDKGCGYDPGD